MEFAKPRELKMNNERTDEDVENKVWKLWMIVQ